MNIGIIGSGNVGGTLGKAWAKRGHKILFSYSRDPKKLESLATSAGPNARVGSPADAVQFGEAILFAPPWPAVDHALKAAGPLSGKILIDCTNPLKQDLSGLEIGHTTSAAEEIAKKTPGVRVVKAFNMTGAENMASSRFGAQQATMFICGDDAAAKTVIARLTEELGFEAVDAGPLQAARLLEPLAMLWIHLAYGQKMGSGIGFKLLRR
ncbi:MAG: NADPH-dependent F420 reductase [Candidatus Methylomirabilales bacterium]